eukprot:GHVU01112075.1.p1 GENE.GHVU01112075.1~~GHVU01112075.1.p1  ORF type:complete len:308 (+),score=55.49 GHVU01112075.1:243-1166(+)
MSELDDAKAALKVAEDKVQKLSGELEKLQIKKSSKYFYKEKKFSKFDGSEDVRDWCESIHKYVNARFADESEKIDFIVDHLAGNPKAEIKFRLKSMSSTKAGDLLQILIDVFSDRDRATKLLQTFYSRDQQKEESLEDYSYVLIELMTKMNRLGVKQVYNPDFLLKERFASGVLDVNLRRELQRLSEEQQGLQFHQLREKAIRWTEEDPPISSPKNAECSKQDTTDVLDIVTKQQAIIQEQQKQLAQVSDTLKTWSSNNPSIYTPRFQNTSNQPRFQNNLINPGSRIRLIGDNQVLLFVIIESFQII